MEGAGPQIPTHRPTPLCRLCLRRTSRVWGGGVCVHWLILGGVVGLFFFHPKTAFDINTFSYTQASPPLSVCPVSKHLIILFRCNLHIHSLRTNTRLTTLQFHTSTHDVSRQVSVYPRRSSDGLPSPFPHRWSAPSRSTSYTPSMPPFPPPARAIPETVVTPTLASNLFQPRQPRLYRLMGFAWVGRGRRSALPPCLASNRFVRRKLDPGIAPSAIQADSGRLRISGDSLVGFRPRLT